MVISKNELGKIKSGDTKESIIADITEFEPEINDVIRGAAFDDESTATFKTSFTYEIGMADEDAVDIMSDELIVPIRAHATNEAINIVGKYFSKLGYKVTIKLISGSIYTVSLELK